jgi:hypothetical protein
MKKNVFIAVFAVCGLVMVSCSADTEELENANQKSERMVTLKQDNGLFLKEGDSIIITNTSESGDEGVDDGTIPPKKP